jgi:hypothetical protein
VAGAGAQSYNSAGAGDEKPEFAQHYTACPKLSTSFEQVVNNL